MTETHRELHSGLIARPRVAPADDLGSDEIALLPVPDHLRAAHAAKRPEGREQVNGLEDVRLALRVVAQQQVKTGREIGVQPRVISEIAKSQMGQMHSEELAVLHPTVSPFFPK